MGAKKKQKEGTASHKRVRDLTQKNRRYVVIALSQEDNVTDIIANHPAIQSPEDVEKFVFAVVTGIGKSLAPKFMPKPSAVEAPPPGLMDRLKGALSG